MALNMQRASPFAQATKVDRWNQIRKFPKKLQCSVREKRTKTNSCKITTSEIWLEGKGP